MNIHNYELIKKLISNKKAVYGIIAGVFCAGLFITWGIRQAIQSKKLASEALLPDASAFAKIPVTVYRTSRANFVDTLDAMGTVEGGSQVELAFRKEGTVQEILFKEGDFVEKHTVIARLDAHEDALKLEQAELEYEQHKKLFDAGVIIQTKLDQIRLALEQAKEEFRKNLLEAPISGMIATIEYKPGEFVNPSRIILTMFDVSRMIVKIGITEHDINKLKLNQTARVTCDALPDMRFTGAITNLNPTVDETLRMMTAEISVDNPEKLILPGMFARTAVTVFKEEHALKVPNKAMQQSEKGYYVFVVRNDNTVSLRDIEAGYIARDYAVIRQGLNENEQVVLNKFDLLKDGAAVEIVKNEVRDDY